MGCLLGSVTPAASQLVLDRQLLGALGFSQTRSTAQLQAGCVITSAPNATTQPAACLCADAFAGQSYIRGQVTAAGRTTFGGDPAAHSGFLAGLLGPNGVLQLTDISGIRIIAVFPLEQTEIPVAAKLTPKCRAELDGRRSTHEKAYLVVRSLAVTRLRIEIAAEGEAVLRVVEMARRAGHVAIVTGPRAIDVVLAGAPIVVGVNAVPIASQTDVP